MPNRTPLTDAEREQRRAADRAFVQQAVDALRSSDGWQRWLTARRHFHTYSLRDQLLIAMQKPEATRVAGFKAWLALGYCVRRGEKGLRSSRPARRASPGCKRGATQAPIRRRSRGHSSGSPPSSTRYLVIVRLGCRVMR